MTALSPELFRAKSERTVASWQKKILMTNDFEESQCLYENRIALKESFFGNSLHLMGSFDSGSMKVRIALKVDVSLTLE